MDAMNVNELECIQCNKCMLNCPLNRVDPTYSPRGYILQLLGEGDENFIKDADLYRCLTCFQCKEVCPSSNKYIDLVKQTRKKARDDDFCDECKHGNILRTIQELQANLDVPQNRVEGLDPEMFTQSGDTLYFMGCLPIFEEVFPHTKSISTAQNTLKIMNTAGVRPVVSNDEKCCGYDLLWSGEEATFQTLARKNLKFFKELGIKKIVTSCAECLVTLKEEYPKIDDVEWEVQHITQFAAEKIKSGELKLEKEVAEKMTYHDPCRLGRVSKVYDEPRFILDNVKGLELVEMDNIRENSSCCGVGNFSNCDSCTKFLQHDRLKEAEETGADHLLTACPKCRIHFNCYLDGKPIEELREFEITDITEIIAKAIDQEKDHHD